MRTVANPAGNCVAALFVILFLFGDCSAAIARSRLPSRPPSPAPSVGAMSLDVARLVVAGAVKKPLSLSLIDLGGFPRQILRAKSEHDTEEHTYQGVLLTEILKRAGVPQGEELRGADMATHVIAEGEDGYRATFSLAELDASFQDSGVLVADTMDGEPIGGNVGPLRLIVPHDKRSGRWVRMLRLITVVTAGK